MKADNDNKRLLSRQEAAAYCGVSTSTFSGWVSSGHMPKPLFGSKRWDKKAIDDTLDKASGLRQVTKTDGETALQKFLREANAS